jgi:hypothetical protein
MANPFGETGTDDPYPLFPFMYNNQIIWIDTIKYGDRILHYADLKGAGFLYHSEPGNSFWSAPGSAGFGQYPTGGATGGTSGGSYGYSSSGGSSSGGGGGYAGPSEYDLYSKAAKHAAKQYGIPLTDALIKYNFNQQTTIEELDQRLQAISWTRENNTYLNQFEAELKARGLLGKNASTTLAERVNIALRRAPKPWLDLWETAATRTAAVRAGFDISKQEGDLEVSRSAIQGLLGRLEDRVMSASQILPSLQQAANLALELGPYARYKKYGLSKKELLNVGAGIAGAKTTSKLQRMVAEVEAFSQFRSYSPFQIQERSLAGQGGS